LRECPASARAASAVDVTAFRWRFEKMPEGEVLRSVVVF
jgi:hypothetical protein